MAEYIERKEMVSEMLEAMCGTGYQQWAIDVINRQPAADVVEVKQGHWFLLDECSNAGVYCSVCHKKVYKEQYANQKLKSKFCPNCGAKMDGERRCENG
jgi:hypothetical protein